MLTVPKRIVINLKQLPKNNKTVKKCVKGGLKKSKKAINFFCELLRQPRQLSPTCLSRFKEEAGQFSRVS